MLVTWAMLLIVMAVASECQVKYPTTTSIPSPKIPDTCIASNGQKGVCYGSRTAEFKECSFFPSTDTDDPDVKDHLLENTCINTGREIYICCPSAKEKSICPLNFMVEGNQCVYDNIANTLSEVDARDACAEIDSKLLKHGEFFICEARTPSPATTVASMNPASLPSPTGTAEHDNVAVEPNDPTHKTKNYQVVWYVIGGVSVLVTLALMLVLVVYMHLQYRHQFPPSSNSEEIVIEAINESYESEGIHSPKYQNGSFYENELINAVIESDVNRAKWSLQHGANPNTTFSWKTLTSFPVLCNAVEGEDIEIVKVLLETESIEVNKQGDGQCTPLYIATRKGYRDIAEKLLLHGADPDLASSSYSWTPLMTAVETDNCDIAELLIMNGASLDLNSGEFNTTPLYVAVVKNKEKIAALLIKNGASIELISGPYDYSPLMAAVMENKCKMAELLLVNGAIVVNKSGPSAMTPILAAVMEENCNMLAVLIKNRPSLDLKYVEPDRLPLLYAAKAGNHKMCHLLLQNGANPDATDNDGYNSIYAAAQCGHKNVIRLLIDYGGDPKQPRIGYSSTASDIAREHSHNDLAEWLDTQRKLHRRVAKDVGPDEIYPNESALLCFLNYIEFPDGYRYGADKDKANIMSTFNDLKYSIDYHENLSNSETSSVLEELQKDKRLLFKDSLIILINSHGSEDSIFHTSDGLTYNMNLVKSYFTNRECPQLKYKPKVIIANCCRGKGREVPDNPMEIGKKNSFEEDASAILRKNIKLPKHLVMINSASEGIVSLRNVETGSYFLQYFCEMLRSKPRDELMVIINSIADKMIKEKKHHPTCTVELPFRKFVFKLQEPDT